ncbi:MAG: hypothetical protein JW821_12025 [Deltaproteobacteria bacterium]|nr:hypothetical protein [Deltaproteobacteria bacterium]
MPAARVYCTDIRASSNENLPAKPVLLMDRIDLKGIVSSRTLVAIKVHFGEKIGLGTREYELVNIG